MEVALFNRQRSVKLPVERLREFAETAPRVCLPYPGRASSVLRNLSAVEISLVSDRVIARMHREFLNVPGPTDVMTFPHGEIAISAATAVRHARQNGESAEREIVRYIVHGFLHLHGHEDIGADDAAAMWRAQERILNMLWPLVPAR